jgi:hypothetical protein
VTVLETHVTFNLRNRGNSQTRISAGHVASREPTDEWRAHPSRSRKGPSVGRLGSRSREPAGCDLGEFEGAPVIASANAAAQVNVRPPRMVSVR